MRKCPYCAEEIQDEAIKCKHCGEWLRNDIKFTGPKDGSFISNLFNIKPKLETITNKKTAIYIISIPLLIIVFDIIFSLNIYSMKNRLTYSQLQLVIYSLYISLGIMISSFTYNKINFVIITISSIVILFILRIIMVALMEPGQVSHAIINTIYEAIPVFGATIVVGFLLRYTESLFKFADIGGIVYGFEDHKTKKKYDMGICSNCGITTKIAKERFMTFLPKSENYFCDNCGRFIRGNPLKNIFMGFSEIVVSFILLIGWTSSSHKSGSQSSSYNGILSLFYLVMLYDGFKRSIFSIIGVYKSITAVRHVN